MNDYLGLPNFREALEAAGWRIGLNPITDRYNSCNWYAWSADRVDITPNCAHNERPPSLTVWPSYFPIESGGYAGCELEICGEVQGRHWLKFRVYTLKPETFFDAYPLARKQLLAAWKAAAEVKA